MVTVIGQVLDDPDAGAWAQWLNWGYWLVLVASVAAIIAGGATIAVTTNTEQGRWGRHMVIAGLAGALAAALLPQWIRWCYDLIVA